MARRTKRQLERALADLDDAEESTSTLDVAWRDETDTPVDRDGNPVDPSDDGMLVVFNYHEVMSRDRAEREGREIIGPTDDELANDAVRVTREGPLP